MRFYNMICHFAVTWAWIVILKISHVCAHITPHYALREAGAAFDEAEFNCQATGMTMVKFDSTNEYDDIVQFVLTMKGYGKMIGSIWIGLKHDGTVNGTSNEHFKWSDGTALSADFNCWLNAEPNLSPTKPCVAWRYNYKADPCEFYMASCSSRMAYVCKDVQYMTATPAPPIGTFTLPELYAATMNSYAKTPFGSTYGRYTQVHGTFNETGLMFTSQGGQIRLFEDCLAVCLSRYGCRRAAFEKNAARACHLFHD